MAESSNYSNELIQRWLQEDNEDSVSSSESEEEEVCEQRNVDLGSPHQSDTEQESENEEEDEDEDVPLSALSSYQSRNGTKWSKFPPPTSRTRSHNILARPPGPLGAAKDAKTALQSFLLFFDNDVWDILVDSTNIYIDTIKDKYQRARDASQTDVIEIKAFIGILLVIGTCHSGRRNLKSFWNNSKGTGIELVYTTMSESRFRFLLRALRFDDVRGRLVRQEHDRLAAVRQITNIMLQNCKKYYSPSENLTIDEQLVAFKGRCGFIMYMPNKPAKFGIKIIMVVDIKYPYAHNFEIYAGTQPEGPFRQSNKVPDVVHRILCPLYGLGCNVTMDNWFTNVPMCRELLTNKITVVGTLKKNKPEIPDLFKTTQNREIKESTFGFQPDCTLVSYVPKRNKVVLLLSTLHNDDTIDPASGDARKPEIITFYNHTKYGVDIFDKMCRQYDVTRNSRRWPLTLFYNFINMAGINGLVIYQLNNPDAKVIRREYLEEVGFELARPCIERRVSQQTIPRGIKLKGRLLLGLEDQLPYHSMPTRRGPGRCSFCPRARDRSTRKQCGKCMRRICTDHQHLVCHECMSLE